MPIAALIRKKLMNDLKPTSLEVIDESHLHAGHVGSRPEGETHFRVKIVSNCFSGLTRVQAQRLVYSILSDEMTIQIHALSIHASKPNK